MTTTYTFLAIAAFWAKAASAAAAVLVAHAALAVRFL